MFTATINTTTGTITATIENVETLFHLAFNLNEDIYVNNIQISAKDGKWNDGTPSCAGYTLNGLKHVLGVTE